MIVCIFQLTNSKEILKYFGVPVCSEGLTFMLKVAVCSDINLEGVVNACFRPTIFPSES